jgi:tryptophan halogenase
MIKTDNIVIVGGGSSGWMTAATLIKAFPNKNIRVIESKDVPIVGVGESTLGGIKKWIKFIGLDEKKFIPYTDASYKLSIKFTDFYKKDYGSFHYPFGKPMVDFDRNPFSDWHFKKYFYPDIDVNDFTRSLFPASYLYENNKFSFNKNEEFDNFDPLNDVAYHFDAVKFGKWLKEEYCIPKGVKHIVGTVENIKINDSGIEYLILNDGDKIFSDLYIDCTGFKSILLSNALKEPFNDYSDFLPNNRAWATKLEYKNRSVELEGFTNSTAIENGWCWNIPLWSRLGSGYVYSDKFVEPEEAKEEFKKYLMSNKMIIPRTKEEVESLDFKDIKMRVGLHERTFVKNVVAIGLSAGFIEPLESNGLFTVHEFLFKLIDILQRNEVSQFDRDMYNVSVKNLFHGFAKFVALHYALSHRNDTEYWKEITKKTFSDSSGDPYSDYQTKVNSFEDMGWRYMSNWAHPLADSGITYISTGMNVNMINDHRTQYLLDHHKTNKDIFYNEMMDVFSLWEKRKDKWKSNSISSKTLEDFLFENFYSNN